MERTHINDSSAEPSELHGDSSFCWSRCPKANVFNFKFYAVEATELEIRTTNFDFPEPHQHVAPSQNCPTVPC
jgi:hypothetical protein